MENLDPPSPQIKDGKMARFCPSCAFILDLGGWGFVLPFYFVQDCRPAGSRRECYAGYPRRSSLPVDSLYQITIDMGVPFSYYVSVLGIPR